MKLPQSPINGPKDWLLHQGPKFEDGLPLRARRKLGTLSDLPAVQPTAAYRGIAKGLSSSDVDFEPDRF